VAQWCMCRVCRRLGAKAVGLTRGAGQASGRGEGRWGGLRLALARRNPATQGVGDGRRAPGSGVGKARVGRFFIGRGWRKKIFSVTFGADID